MRTLFVIASLLIVANLASAQSTASSVCASTLTREQCTASPLCTFGDICTLKPCRQRTYGNCTDTTNSADTCFGYVSGLTKACTNCEIQTTTTSPSQQYCPDQCVAQLTDTGAIASCDRKCTFFSETQCTSTNARAARCQVASTSSSNTAGSTTTTSSKFCTEIPKCDTTNATLCDTRTGGFVYCNFNSLAQKCQPMCSRFFSSSLCTANSHCSWNANTNTCVATALSSCDAAGTYEICAAATPGCTFNYTSKKCYVSPCTGRWTRDTCTMGAGKTLGCFFYGQQSCASCSNSNCDTKYACTWIMGSTSTSPATEMCVRACQTFETATACSAESRCNWNQTTAKCVVAPKPTATTVAPTTSTASDAAPTTTKALSCSDLSMTQCTSADAARMGCFVAEQMCTSCRYTSASDCYNNNACIFNSATNECRRKCKYFTSNTCPASCQVYTPKPTERTTLQCTDRDYCPQMYSSDERGCKADENCKWDAFDAICNNGCLAWKNAVDCAAQAKSALACSWDSTNNVCNSNAPLDCRDFTATTCSDAAPAAAGCFLFYQQCVGCNLPASANVAEECPAQQCNIIPTATGAPACVRGCMTLSQDACPDRCQIYTPMVNERSPLQCYDRPNCKMAYSTQAGCNAADNCLWDAASAVCQAKCSSWRNMKDCNAQLLSPSKCSWDESQNYCVSLITTTAAPTTAAPTKPGDTTRPAALTCFDLSVDQCKSNEACFVYNQKCVSCVSSSSNTAAGSTNFCSTDFCISEASGACIRKCQTFTSTECATLNRCQVYTPKPTERTTTQCWSRPNCRMTYSTQAACNGDMDCSWDSVNAVCLNACGAWKNANDCAANTKCSWDTTTGLCFASAIYTKPTVTDATKLTVTQATRPMETTTAGPTNAPTQCSDLTTGDMCKMYADKWACMWNLRSGACVSRPCTNRTATNCWAGDGQRRGCFLIKQQYCSSCNSAECDSRVCEVNSDATCTRHCWTFATETECSGNTIAAASNCQWNTTTMMCQKYRAPVKPLPPVEPPTFVPCPDRSSATCTAPDCAWNQDSSVCKFPACNTYTADKCPEKRCTIRAVQDATSGAWSKQCSDICPDRFPVFCESTNVCAESLDKCQKCSSNQVLCWNSKCANSLVECDCPSTKPVRCPSNNRCVEIKDACEATNTCSGTTCWDGTCITSTTSVDPATGKQAMNRCPCPSATPTRCDDGSCARSADSCASQCAEPTPTKCWNGECATNLAACSCPTDKPVRCSTDNKCASSLDACQCPEGTEKCAAAATTTNADGTTTTTSMKCAKIGSCQITCPADKPTRCEFGTGADACAESQASCPCPETAWANAVVVAQIHALASTTMDIVAGQSKRVSASALAYVCRSKREITAQFAWRLVDVSGLTKTVVKLPTSIGSAIEIDTSLLTPGHEYSLSVVATLVRRGLDLSSAPSATASVSFTAAKKRPEVVILGGAERQLSNNDNAVNVAIDPRKAGGDVDADGSFKNLPTVVWSCACAAGTSCTTCPAVITNALAQATGVKVAIDTTTNKIPAGTYIIKATVQVCSAKKPSTSTSTTTGGLDNDCDGISTTQTVVVAPTVKVAAQVSIFGVPSTQDLMSATKEITLYARSSVDGAKIAWSVNGSPRESNGKSLSFAASSLTPGMTYNIVVTATAEDGTTATAKASFTVPTKISGSCAVTISSSTTDDTTTTTNNVQAQSIASLETPLALSSEWMGVDASVLRFRFGYYLNGGTVWLTDSSSELSSFKFVAPMVTGDSARPVKFFVSARHQDSKSELAMATCAATIVPASSNKAADQVTKAWENIQDSRQSNDTSRLASVAATLSGVAKKLTDQQQKKTAQALAVRAVETLANSTTGDKLSRAQRSTIIQGLSAAFNSEDTTAPSVNTNTNNDNSESRKGKTTVMNSTMQEVAVRTVLRAVTAPKEGADDKDSLDSRKDARAALQILSNITIKKKEIVQAAASLARNLAAQGDLGKKVQENSYNISVSAVTLPGDSNNRFILNATNSSIAFPAGFSKFTDETNRYSIAATEFKNNLLGTNGAPSGKKISGSVVDFVVQTNGQHENITDSTKPIEIRTKHDTAKNSINNIRLAQSGGDKKKPVETGAECKYFNEKTNSWSSEGVTTGPFNEDDGTVTCYTTHLSTYAVFFNSEIVDGADSNSGNTNTNNGAAESGSSLSSGQRTALIAGVLGGVALLVAAALFIRAKRNNGTGYKGGDVSLDDNMNHLLFAAPQMDYDETEMLGNNKREFANL